MTADKFESGGRARGAKMRMSVPLATETDWLERIVLAEDSASAHPARLVRTGTIETTVPGYASHGARWNVPQETREEGLRDR